MTLKMILHKSPVAITSVVGAKHFSQWSKKFRFGFFEKIFSKKSCLDDIRSC